ncbi:peptidoglycan-N-acetylmuramic acid deacetylase PdaA precursor [mine drainage metagenome]|uniref:Peptidoglycan-N-acetylmuramic acid deacetylase PdaA n=1 Tax=mine drainage metagenome TaxID=410659 RepID=A0A1J5SHS8_9ZZZZ
MCRAWRRPDIMPTWISRAALAWLLLLLPALPAAAKVITRLPTADKVVALTFDACESRTPAFLDHGISDFLVAHQIPFTIFVSGRFARHNGAALAALGKLDFVELENHSMNHFNHMERLPDQAIRQELAEADAALFQASGRHSRYFRFPAGNYDARSLAVVEQAGYKVVHWSFASGDPGRSVTPAHLTEWVLLKTRPGDILIFHINGRGWSTARALPGIVAALQRRGYRFTRLDRMLP